MNNVSYNLALIMEYLWQELNRVYYWDSIPFTLWDIVTCGFIVSVFALFLERIVFIYKNHD